MNKTIKYSLFITFGIAIGTINLLLIDGQTLGIRILSIILSILVFISTVSLLIVMFDKKK